MANVYLPSQTISPASHSNSLRKPSDATSTRSIGFASDRSPLQNLELELKHISKEEFDAPGVGRSLSKRQEERLQRSTTITSRLTASPPVPSPINTYPIGDESHQHRSHRMAQLLGSSPSEVKSEDGRRNSPPNADALGKPQSVTKLSPAQISGRDRIGRKSYQGYRFQHLRRTSSSGTKSNKGDHTRITRAAGGKDVFDVKVAHLTIEDREFGYQSLSGGDATKDDAPRAGNTSHNDSRDFFTAEDITDNQISEPKNIPAKPISSVNSFRPVTVIEPTRMARTKEEKKDELIFSFIAAIKRRATPAPTTYSPPLHVKCGPLLRYTGLRRDGKQSNESSAKDERETWRGSVMIVTTDDQSDYTTVPRIRLFVQPALSSVMTDTNNRTETTNTSAADTEDLNNNLKNRKDGEILGKYREVEGTKLHSERGITFWRFTIEVELGDEQARIAYRINHGPVNSFWVPSRTETMNIMFYSCNGFSLSVNPADFCGPDPLWRDVIREHEKKPFHVMLGGGDQLYNDAVSKKTKLFKEWLAIKNPIHKNHSAFTDSMADELEEFYLERYCMWFSQGLFGVANAQIPMINIWDDHDIIDGFGSYPDHFNRCPVFKGLGAVAFKYYLLFQHQSIVDELEGNEPSWLLGAAPGPYIAELSRSCFMFLGRKVAFLGLDCRTERMRDLVLSESTYNREFLLHTLGLSGSKIS
ncbi:uncharacterized protein LAJ45_11224 [Morchella importuna]|uniref:uncharacterized protein n=1 Tax=Morchella importuna TaxID=1174673 RepID=UPI001E8CD871|nr:uncharacterized protein LAJ45_11224 [Morchella importuna]KAH8144723.1 hypothetical protein LAJ45_11224 [Morchella importuna]